MRASPRLLLVPAIVTALLLCGCTESHVPQPPASVTEKPSPPAEEVSQRPATPVADVTPLPEVTVPSPAPGVLDPNDRETIYNSEVAEWSDPLPDGYRWPTLAQVPVINGGQLREAQNAAGIYRCMLIDATWHAYFEENDPEASMSFALHADEYLIPNNPSVRPLVVDGLIDDYTLAASNGICLGISGAELHG